MEQAVIGAVAAFSLLSNVFLWVNVWNLKKTLFEFQCRNIEYLKELCEKPAEEGQRGKGG